jgi:nondiscriminating aspartyl-tRNA synthetase
MERTLAKETIKKVGQKVKLQGWVNTVRDHGSITFIDLRDRSGVIQCVGEGLIKAPLQSVVEIIGEVKKRPDKMVNQKIGTGGVEIKIEKLDFLAKAEELPFDMGKDELELQLPTLLDYRTLTLRNKRVSEIFKVQEAIMEGFRRAAQELDCVEIFVPTISSSSTEGGAEVFKIDYYGHEAFLIQSPQLYKQMLIPAFERVYLVSHAYRSEPSVTTRHMAESIQMDCELGFVNFGQLMDALEFVARETLKYVEASCKEILKDYKVPKLSITKEVPRLTMREAQKIIKERTQIDHTSEPDLGPDDEREIGRWAAEERGSDLVTITHYPTKKRAFYTMPDPKDKQYSLSYDLIFKGMEILSGSQRINDYNELVTAIKDRGMNPDNFKMYLQAFEYAMPPEGGFSFGLERVTMQVLNLQNIREASLFPRDMERVDFNLNK